MQTARTTLDLMIFVPKPQRNTHERGLRSRA